MKKYIEAAFGISCIGWPSVKYLVIMVHGYKFDLVE